MEKKGDAAEYINDPAKSQVGKKELLYTQENGPFAGDLCPTCSGKGRHIICAACLKEALHFISDLSPKDAMNFVKEVTEILLSEPGDDIDELYERALQEGHIEVESRSKSELGRLRHE